MTQARRVVQWATGNIGKHSLREIIRHPDLELVGVFTYDPNKEGLDAGELCGVEPVGVAATTDRQAILDLAADCVLYMPSTIELDDVVALLASGTNVIATRGELFFADTRLGDEGWERIRAACEQGGSSLYTTGSSPGFITDALPFSVLSLQRHVELIEIEEFADLSRRDSPEMLFGLMGFAKEPTSFREGSTDWMIHEFGPALSVLAEAAGRPVDAWHCSGEVGLAGADLTIVAGEIPAGTVAAQRSSISGLSEGAEVIRFTANWFCTRELDPAWDLLATGWRVQVRGDAPVKLEIEFPVELDDFTAVMPGYTGNRPVNAIAYVCAAAPGILRTADLPAIVPAGPRP